MGKKVNQTELAEITGVSDVTLWAWQKEGMPVEERNTRGQSHVYDTADVITWITDRAVKKVRTETPRDELARAQTDLVKMQIAEKLGELVSAKETEQAMANVVVRARQRFDQVGMTLPIDDGVRQLLRQEINEALMELSRYDGCPVTDAPGSEELGAAGETAIDGLGGDEPLHERQVTVPGEVPAVGHSVPPGGSGGAG